MSFNYIRVKRYVGIHTKSLLFITGVGTWFIKGKKKHPYAIEEQPVRVLQNHVPIPARKSKDFVLPPTYPFTLT